MTSTAIRWPSAVIQPVPAALAHHVDHRDALPAPIKTNLGKIAVQGRGL